MAEKIVKRIQCDDCKMIRKTALELLDCLLQGHKISFFIVVKKQVQIKIVGKENGKTEKT